MFINFPNHSLHVKLKLSLILSCQISCRLPRITVRTVIFLMVLTCRGCYWFLEQPGSSQVRNFPELVLLRTLMDASGIASYFQRLSEPQWFAFKSITGHAWLLSWPIESVQYIRMMWSWWYWDFKISSFMYMMLSSWKIAPYNISRYYYTRYM